jgi:alkanesulfonate monooxygenase SsuD/methylene tetrahydromethanopterin reductase-like flavin-dependent oxidoreductase (luciferase family)
MKIGIGLPTWLGNLVTGREVLDWARRADEAGFHAVAVHDRPFHDTWDPIAALAVVAPVTTRVRLATGALLLPMRDEALVAKQAAVIDQVSEGRLDLGVALGARPEDFGLFGRTPAGRGRVFEAQLRRLTALWDDAQRTAETGDGAGPASVQRPHPALWIGGYAPPAIERAVTYGDGFIFGAPGVDMMRDRIPAIRAAAEARGKSHFPVAGLAYVLPTTDPTTLQTGERLLTRYYGTLRKPFPELVVHGDTDAVVEQLTAYREAGLDVLHVILVTGDVGMVDAFARDVLPRLAD